MAHPIPEDLKFQGERVIFIQLYKLSSLLDETLKTEFPCIYPQACKRSQTASQKGKDPGCSGYSQFFSTWKHLTLWGLDNFSEYPQWPGFFHFFDDFRLFVNFLYIHSEFYSNLISKLIAVSHLICGLYSWYYKTLRKICLISIGVCLTFLPKKLHFHTFSPFFIFYLYLIFKIHISGDIYFNQVPPIFVLYPV